MPLQVVQSIQCVLVSPFSLVQGVHLPLAPPHALHCPSSVSPPCAATARLSYDQILTRVRILIRETRARSRYGTTMRSYGVTEGTREEILAELDRYGLDASRAVGSNPKADRIAQAWRDVRDGATEVWINDRQMYRVTRTGDEGAREIPAPQEATA